MLWAQQRLVAPDALLPPLPPSPHFIIYAPPHLLQSYTSTLSSTDPLTFVCISSLGIDTVLVYAKVLLSTRGQALHARNTGFLCLPSVARHNTPPIRHTRSPSFFIRATLSVGNFSSLRLSDHYPHFASRGAEQDQTSKTLAYLNPILVTAQEIYETRSAETTHGRARRRRPRGTGQDLISRVDEEPLQVNRNSLRSRLVARAENMIQLSLSQMFNWPAEIPTEGGGPLRKAIWSRHPASPARAIIRNPAVFCLVVGRRPPALSSWRELSKHPLARRRAPPPPRLAYRPEFLDVGLERAVRSKIPAANPAAWALGRGRGWQVTRARTRHVMRERPMRNVQTTPSLACPGDACHGGSSAPPHPGFVFVSGNGDETMHSQEGLSDTNCLIKEDETLVMEPQGDPPPPPVDSTLLGVHVGPHAGEVCGRPSFHADRNGRLCAALQTENVGEFDFVDVEDFDFYVD
ncbi:hypothetical protein C7M84_005354 [Penaeus vannamei]|uniref:Uncharacterized protein n=1 Tax=Penaeus vannamei TaxID=6689 RepID=A0A3R7P5K7_PENVA|nr:hypothetical protein C7M84_005354 [Penaeus vannamei]